MASTNGSDAEEEIPDLVQINEDALSGKLSEFEGKGPEAPSSNKEVQVEEESKAVAPDVDAASEAVEAVPVTIVTGWLGSGKTTFLRQVLENFKNRDQKIAIIQNEASGVGIEDDLKLVDDEGKPVADLKEIGGGCVCCSVRADFVAALEALLKNRKFDHIFVECSGVADPGQLASMFWLDEQLDGGIFLNGVIGVVDARLATLSATDAISRATRNQIAYADSILLNKRDLVDEERIEAMLEELRVLNPCPVFVTTKSKLKNLSQVLSLNAYQPAAAEDAVRRLPYSNENEARNELEHHEHHHHHGHTEGEPCTAKCRQPKTRRLRNKDCVHDESVIAHLIEVAGLSIDLKKLRDWLAEILWQEEKKYSSSETKIQTNTPETNPDNGEGPSNSGAGSSSSGSKDPRILRMKGLLSVGGSERRYYLQAVQQLFEVVEGPAWDADDGSAGSCCLVVIGQNLDRSNLEAGLKACVSQ